MPKRARVRGSAAFVHLNHACIGVITLCNDWKAVRRWSLPPSILHMNQLIMRTMSKCSGFGWRGELDIH